MRDAIEFEMAGVPSVALIHEELTGSADSMKRISGTPDYQYAVVHNPHHNLCGWTDVEIEQVAQAVAPQVAELLLSRE